MWRACGFMRLCQIEAQAEEHASESQKEKKLRDRSEQYSRQLEEELAAVKVCKNCLHILASTNQCLLKQCSLSLISMYQMCLFNYLKL